MKSRSAYLLFAGFIFFITAGAQTPQLPKVPPGAIPLPAPKLTQPRPDLQITNVRVHSVAENEAGHLFRIVLYISYKNAGPVSTASEVMLDLRSRYELPSGGRDFSPIGDPVRLTTFQAGETRTEKWTFTKDVTAMGRARQECILRIDSGNTVAESDEENNSSAFFYITPPPAH